MHGDSAENRLSVLDRYARRRDASSSRGRPVLYMSREEPGEGYATRLLAVHDRLSLVLSIPAHADGRPVSVAEGQVWIFRTLHHTSALRFQAAVLKVLSQPFPHLHVEVPQSIERRAVRRSPRVSVSLPAKMLLPHAQPCLIVDLSIGGARIVIDSEKPMLPGQLVVCSVMLPVGERSYARELRGVVREREAKPDPEFTSLESYRIQFETFDDITALALHAFVNASLAHDLDGFGRLIASN